VGSLLASVLYENLHERPIMKSKATKGKNILSLLAMLLMLSGCIGSVTSHYGVSTRVDQFNNNQSIIRMTGGAIDIDYLGNIANAAQFNPVVIRSTENKILALWFSLFMERTGAWKWLNIREGSIAIFLLDGGSDKITLQASRGDIDYSVTSTFGGVYSTKYDSGSFRLTPQQLMKIAHARNVEIRVVGESSTIDFPRKPNYHLAETFLPNLKRFYETEVKPYSDQ
jgi:hypothetical protein